MYANRLIEQTLENHMDAIKQFQTKIKANADGIVGPNTLRRAMEFYKLTPFRAAHFFGQTSHETGNFTVFTENLNYSAQGLMRVFPKYFDQNTAKQHAGKPEDIANRVYGNRMGNGNIESGDGYRYRGRGALQLTGKDNYTRFSKWIGNDYIVAMPDLVTTKYAFDAAFFFFTHNKIWEICDRGIDDDTITRVTRRVNGGTHGLQDRIEKTLRYYQWVK